MRKLLLLVVLAACTKEPKQTPAPANETGATKPAPIDAGSDCVAKCVHDNQMKATSPENIERECRAECATPAP